MTTSMQAGACLAWFVRVFAGRLAPLLAGLALAFCAGSAAAQCGSTPCDPGTRHNPIWFWLNDGPPQTFLSNADPQAAASQWCAEWAANSSNDYQTLTYSACTLLPLGDSWAGGSWQALTAYVPSKMTRNSDGAILWQDDGNRGFTTAGCDTATGISGIMGVDDHCYCPPGAQWTGSICAYLAQEDDTKTEANPARMACYKDPIFPLTQMMQHDEALPYSIGGLRLSVYYRSDRHLPMATTDKSPPSPIFVNAFGEWGGTLHRALRVEGAGRIEVLRGDGRVIPLQLSIDPLYVGGPDIADTATRTASGYLYRDVAGNEFDVFDASGRLLSIAFADGRSITLGYSDASTPPQIAPVAGLLVTATDGLGRQVHFTYGSEAVFAPQFGAEVATVGDDVNSTSFSYANQALTQITWPDADYRSFLYELPVNPYGLTGIEEEGPGHPRVTSFGWDATGRHVLSTQVPGGLDSASIPDGGAVFADSTESYDDSTRTVTRRVFWASAPSPVVTLNHQTQALASQLVAGVPRLLSRSQPAGSGCTAATSAQGYDGGANVVSHDDFDGHRWCRAYDALNRPVVSLEGLPSTKSCPGDLAHYVPAPVDGAHPERKTSTQWLGAWSLKTSEAGPRKLTTWVYNGTVDPIAADTPRCVDGSPKLPDGSDIAVVCRRYEQSTTDLDGRANLAPTVVATRMWSYTYDQHGQLLTATAPKLSPQDTLPHTTTYAYYTDTSYPDGVSGHRAGDLRSVTRPVTATTSLTTQYTAYDKAGRLLSTTDPNGTVTSMTYWPRGWLHTLKATTADGFAQTTVYDYWPNGLLHVATLPDGTSLTYAYNAAHWLTDVTDGLGNTVHYTLDEVGNRIGEQFKDARGNLAATIARVYDALDRVQSVTGATH